MTNRNKITLALGITTLTLMSGCIVQGPPPPPPSYQATVETDVPDDYAWDGYEYVGVVGDQYYYLGPGHVWIVCDPVRLGHFHDYVRIHPDWHAHAVVNVRFRVDARGHSHPRREAPPRREERDHDHDHP
jgi:hypothetical protein